MTSLSADEADPRTLYEAIDCARGDMEHNYGHSRRHLATFLASLILLAFLAHTVLELCDRGYRAVREQLPSRRTYFEHLRALTQYWPFDSWEPLFGFMREALEPAQPPPTRRAAARGRQV